MTDALWPEEWQRSLAEAFRDAEQPPAVPKIIVVIVEPDGTVGGEMHWADGRFVMREVPPHNDKGYP